MIIIDADKFLSYLIFSKHIDGLTCGEVKEAIEMCKVDGMSDVLDKIKADVEQYQADCDLSCSDNANCRTCDRITFGTIYRIIDKYRKESEEI